MFWERFKIWLFKVLNIRNIGVFFIKLVFLREFGSLKKLIN